MSNVQSASGWTHWPLAGALTLLIHDVGVVVDVLCADCRQHAKYIALIECWTMQQLRDGSKLIERNKFVKVVRVGAVCVYDAGWIWLLYKQRFQQRSKVDASF